ncbi:DUF4870 domain-containing protein [Actinoplanes sp. NBC_00393]|uniref:DUF4870 domain-containing protein n=1 Tax=Actinoplanes sp. NBC_00393 TaxID=2975953 RepID=UPI002E1E56DE
MIEPPRPSGDGNPGDFPPPPYIPPTSGAGGYPPPPPPPPGYQQPGYGYGYPPPPAADDRSWIQLTHFISALLAFLTGSTLGWVMPLIAFLSRGSQSPAVRAEAAQALNFQILWSIITVLGYFLMCVLVGFVIVPVAWLIAWIVPLIAGFKATGNQPFRYPLNISIIK